MAENESAPSVPEQSKHGRDVIRYFLDEQASDPEFMKGLANQLWRDLPSVDKDTMALTQATFFPHDIEGRLNSLKAQLVVDYIRQESARFIELSRVFDESQFNPNSTATSLKTDEL